MGPWLVILALFGSLLPSGDPISIARAHLEQLPSDPAPAALTNSRHYLITNERRLDLFAGEIERQGGVHVGVGAGQNYILAGWSRPSLMVLVDFDQDVVDLHSIYTLFFAFASTPQAYRELWTPQGEALAQEVLEFGLVEPLRRKRLSALYARARPQIDKHLGIMRTKLEANSTKWYLDDPEQYAHVSKLARNQRIIARRGDFTAPGTVRSIADLLRGSQTEVGTLYLSNIEQYFMYRKDFKRNMLAFPLSDHAQVLRTLPGKPAGFEYIVQDAPNFRAWMHDKRTYSVYSMRRIGKGEHLSASAKHRIRELPATCTRSASSACP